jgi:hypothetical protein
MQRRSDDRDTDTVFDWLYVALRCGLVVLVTAAQQFLFDWPPAGLHSHVRVGVARHWDDALNAILFWSEARSDFSH